MTDTQWRDLLRVMDGKPVTPLPVGFIIDSPWLPNWAGISILDYLTHDRFWMDANLKVVRRFPDVMFLPGFWAEYGMCTEPSAFGDRCIWPENDFPSPQAVADSLESLVRLKKPDCRREGMCPFVIKRLQYFRHEIEEAGHHIRFATSRGPHNIAAYLVGQTEWFMGLKTEPELAHRFLAMVTDFIIEWLQHQAATFDTIGGVLVLDDLIGFLGDADFREFVVPYFQRIFSAVPAAVRILHNDCHGLVTARYLREMGANLFNFSFEHSIEEIRTLSGDGVVLLGNLPPRDVLAKATPAEVEQAVSDMLDTVPDKTRLVCSCGGGTPPGVSSANIDAFVAGAR